jgi:SAM-dependent methyltransferase
MSILHRATNAFRRLRAGLPPRGGVSPEVPNDLYQAHLAFYVFAAGYAPGKRTLDAGCGTGYGSARLAAAGALPAVGLDPDARSLAYAARRFPAVRFVAGTAEAPPPDLGTFDLAAMGNVLPHVASPAAAVEGVERHLAPDGMLLASVPPIVDDCTMDGHRASGLHCSNLYLWDWESLFRRRFQEIRLFSLSPPEGARLNFADPSPSRHKAEGFRTEEVPLARLASLGGLTAVFVCKGLRPAV